MKPHCLVTICIITATVLCAANPVGVAAADGPAAVETAFFENRIRPVLVQHCYECHSAKADEVKGGLRLDFAGGLTTGGDSGPALISGKPSESILLDALKYDGMEMPPSGRLPDDVIRDFEKWIADGAVDPRKDAPTAWHGPQSIDMEQGRQFWSFQPFADPGRPEAASAKRSVVDAWLDTALTDAGITAVGEADSAARLRRLYFDLIGLPPSPEQQQSFVADSSATAFADEVDRLMASEQFGVHWGRHWLDVARYADSNGNDFNATFHDAWRYRDYVIRSFNTDKPFDQFVREQIAGDLLPFESDAQRTEQVVATGFLMLGTKMLSERDKDKLRMDVVDEQISTVGTAFLGMTLVCARCHDHKFDPVPKEDYYALAGIFKSTRTLEGESQKYVSTWPRTDLPADAAHVAAVKQFEAHQSALEKQLAGVQKAVKNLETQLKKEQSLSSGDVVDDAAASLVGSWKKSSLTPPFVGAGYIHDDQQDKGAKSVTFRWTPLHSGLFEVRLSYAHGVNRSDSVPITIEHAAGSADVQLDQTKRPTLEGMFAAVGRFEFADSRPAVVTVNTTGTRGYVIADAVQFVPIDADGNYVQSENPSESSTAEGTARRELDDRRLEEKSLAEQLKELKKSAPPPLPQAFAVAEHQEIGDCAVCIRGEHRNLGPVIPRGFLQAASWTESVMFPADQSGRIQLADWLTDPRNPLTARVFVNRVWSHLFGEGLVRTVDNFGANGERPSHPQLLDHLAARFVTPVDRRTAAGSPGFGWSVKALIRELLLTDAYQRSTAYGESAADVDPENRLLWRAHRKRLPAEAVRDALLAVSGRLSLSPDGSPVEGFGVLVKTNDANAEEIEQAESTHRSVYLPVIRSELPPILTVFDFADPDMVVGQRPVTNVPAQALMLMNSPFVMDAASITAERLSSDRSLTVRQLIDLTYRTILNRSATAAEIQRGTEFLDVSDSGRSVADAFRAGAKPAAVEASGDEGISGDAESESVSARFRRFVHVLFASSEFRLLN
ncbi:MAG: DUF1553 domain-containing protein [Planctomycetaceae bacterium]|nr:DUF1553 domain-containing protein [Planctomycetaceae bacterium]